MDTNEKDPIRQQAEATAEAILPQLDARIQSHLDSKVEAMVNAQLEEYGLLDEHGEIIRPPAEPDKADAGPFASFGEQLQAIRGAAQPGAVADPRLGIVAATGMSEGVPQDGGFLVQSDFSSTVWQLMHDTGVVFGRIPSNRVLTISANANRIALPAIDETSRADGSRWGGMRAYWTDEAATITASKPKFRQIEMILNKLAVLAYATDEQLQDTPVLESIISAGFSEEMGFKLDDAVVNGDGVGKPLGLLNAPAKVTVTKESGQAASTIVFNNIVKMWSRLWARSRPNAVWFVNQDVEPELANMSMAVGTGGVPVYLPAGGLAGAPFGSLYGRPVVPIEQCPTLGTEGDIILADMSQYWAIRKGSPRFASSMHVQFTTDETAFRGTFRVDAQPMWTSALTPFKGTNTISPIVTLATRS